MKKRKFQVGDKVMVDCVGASGRLFLFSGVIKRKHQVKSIWIVNDGKVDSPWEEKELRHLTKLEKALQ